MNKKQRKMIDAAMAATEVAVLAARNDYVGAEHLLSLGSARTNLLDALEPVIDEVDAR